MEIAPAMSSAMPPNTTSFEFPRDERPAVKANGTVSPSERPMTLYGDRLAYIDKTLRERQGERTHLGQCPDRRADAHPPQSALYSKRRAFPRRVPSTSLGAARWACRDREPPQRARLGVGSCEWR